VLIRRSQRLCDRNPGELLERRPDVRAAERRLAAATERQGIASASLFPQVSVSGFVGFLAGRAALFLPGLDGPRRPLPACRGRRSIWVERALRVRGSSAAADEALASYEETVLRALEETESSFASYHASRLA